MIEHLHLFVTSVVACWPVLAAGAFIVGCLVLADRLAVRRQRIEDDD